MDLNQILLVLFLIITIKESSLFASQCNKTRKVFTENFGEISDGLGNYTKVFYFISIFFKGKPKVKLIFFFVGFSL